MNVSIRIPRFTHQKKVEIINPFFDVLDVPLVRDFSGFPTLTRTYDVKTKSRDLVNAETGKSVGQVSDKYKLTTHREARKIAWDFLDKIGLEFKSQGAQVSNNGSRYFETLSFPGLAFNPASDTPSTAFDSLGARKDVIFPTLTMRNSYDKTSPVSFTKGLLRQWCLNGSTLPYGKDVTLSFRHTQIVNEDKVRTLLIESLEESVRLGHALFKKLNDQNGTEYLQNVLNASFSDKFKQLVIEKLAQNAAIDLDVKTNEKGQTTEWVVKNAETKATAYAIWNVVTDVTTHELTNRYEQETTNSKISRIFTPEPV